LYNLPCLLLFTYPSFVYTMLGWDWTAPEYSQVSAKIVVHKRTKNKTEKQLSIDLEASLLSFTVLCMPMHIPRNLLKHRQCINRYLAVHNFQRFSQFSPICWSKIVYLTCM
jgi:hypothetical protein